MRSLDALLQEEAGEAPDESPLLPRYDEAVAAAAAAANSAAPAANSAADVVDNGAGAASDGVAGDGATNCARGAAAAGGSASNALQLV